ncbi:MAG: membrane protein insertase YidC [Proteobacteria bacterium]|nr:membrane protein insertase YidC [Pseudomonadota bacterium]
MDNPNPLQRQRLLLALAISGLILLGFDAIGRHYLGVGIMGSTRPQAAATSGETLQNAAKSGEAAAMALPQAAVAGKKVQLANSRVQAEVELTGGRVDSLKLMHYAETNGGPKGYEVFKPEGDHAEYLAGGWLGAGIEGPGEGAVWQVKGQAGEGKVELEWKNATGQVFERTLELLPDSYLLQVTDSVTNGAALPVGLTPYVQIHQAGGIIAGQRSSWVNFFGPMGVVDGVSHEESFSSLAKDGATDKVSGRGGWWGLTDQYFMAAVLPGTDADAEHWFHHSHSGPEKGGTDFYSASVQWPQQVLAAGAGATQTYQVYAGPKHDPDLAAAGHDLDRAIDWGWFKLLAKPLYHTLVWLHGLLFGSWALAIVALTMLLKLATFPLANKSYHAMSKMKKMQPKVAALKERHKDDQQALALATMALYKEHKVNPASGCWPMFIQIPIFFAMYKVILVAFEFRHAPLGLWIHDMSAADPLFVLPVLMGCSMFIQFKLNPPAADPMQASVFKWMPVFMTVMFLWFPAGLVWYWLTNNVLSIGQQAHIMRKDRAL